MQFDEMGLMPGKTLMLLSAVAFIQDEKFFSSAPTETQAVLQPREQELFYGARAMGWLLVFFPAASALAAWICSRI